MVDRRQANQMIMMVLMPVMFLNVCLLMTGL